MKPIIQTLPVGHEEVNWANGYSTDPCRHCGKLFSFRGCRIFGKLWIANCCNECSIKYDLAYADKNGNRRRFSAELCEHYGWKVTEENMSRSLEKAWEKFPNARPRSKKEHKSQETPVSHDD
jgi:hypothetical protein